MNTCVHYEGYLGPGMMRRKNCHVGVDFDDVTAGRAGPIWERLPCSNPQVATCPQRELPTREEAEREEAALMEHIRSVMAKRRRGWCDICDEDARPLVQVGSCVYGSCGHRFYQGTLPAGGDDA